MKRKIKAHKRVNTKTKPKPIFDLAWFYNLSDDTKKEFIAFIYLILAIFIGLVIFNIGGVIGQWIYLFIKKIIGNSIYAIPIILMMLSLYNLFSDKYLFNKKTFIGFFIFIISLSALLHNNLPIDNDIALNIGIKGEYGGYIGFLSTWFLRIGLGDIFAYVFFSLTLIFGFFMIFDLNFTKIFNYIKYVYNYFFIYDYIRNENKKILKNKQINDNNILQIRQNNNSYNNDKKGFNIKQVKQKELIIKAPDLDIKKNLLKKISSNFEINDKPISGYTPPSLDLLEYTSQEYKINEEKLKEKAIIIQDKLAKFDIPVEMNDVSVGPTVIQYTLKPSDEVKLSKIISLEKDLALALEAQSIRIEAPIPGKSLVGIELPNENRINVRMRDLFESDEYKKIKSNLRLIIGRDVSNKPFIGDLKEMPHLLIAGQTGSGKSVGVNAIIISLLYQNSPADLRMIMIDPKQVELGVYNNIPHLLAPIISEIDKAISSLKWAINEMERRYKIMKEAKVRDIDEFNMKLENKDDRLYKIVIIIDEMADLMMQAGKEAETLIVRLAQKARATGIHLILATQRPSVNVVTGLIKANMPTRIAFTTASIVDSKTILDYGGAEKLLNKGDMLYKSASMKDPIRIQGVFVSTKEVNKVVNRIKIDNAGNEDNHYSIESNIYTNYNNESNDDDNIIKPIQQDDIATEIVNFVDPSEQTDETLAIEAMKIILKTKKASASYLQRSMRLGYARASRIIDMLTERGWLGQANGAKPRDIIYSAIPDKIKSDAGII